MIEQKIEDHFKAIFGVKKVSFDEPGESHEQDCLFVEIENSRNQPKDGHLVAQVSGKAMMIATNDKLPLGFFSGKIDKAKEHTKDFFFSDFETNTRRFRNLVQRGFSFVYFFDGQYDPDLGTIESVTITITEE